MRTINLIPKFRLIRASRRRWTFVWGAVAVASLGLAGALGAAVSASDPLRSRSLEDQIAAETAKLQDLKAKASRDRTEARRIASALAARRSVGRHPDFSRLLAALAARSGEVLMESIDVDRRDTPGATKTTPGTRKYVFTIAGVAPKQTSAAEFIAGLESWRVFDRVTLLGSQARLVRGVDAVSFRVEALIEEKLHTPGGSK